MQYQGLSNTEGKLQLMKKPFFMFSGQGAQSVGMGKDLCEANPAAAAVFALADRTLDWSVSEVCFSGPEDKLKESRYCQPAIYTMSCACLAAFREKFPQIEPVGCAGLSLGEFAALQAAGMFSFVDGLKLVAKRGELMDAACRETVGGMASVLSGDQAIIDAVCAECGIDVANFNCPGQVVISGEAAKVDQAVALLKERGLRKVIPLKVAGAYHSRLMAKAGELLIPVLENTPMKAGAVAIAQNYPGTLVSGNVSEIKANLVKQVAGSVRWDDCVRAMIARGADVAIEFGPGSVLTGLLKRIDNEIPGINVSTAEQLSALTL